MFNTLLAVLKKLWNIRVLILVSLSLQTILILLAPLRKRTSQKLVILFIWTSYVMADWAATFAIGHIFSGQGKADFLAFGHLFSNSKNKSHTCFCVDKVDTLSTNTDDFIAFWAPFLLVHLGGPDTITAFALEDNELWLRHLISFISQLAVTAYVFLLTLPENKLLIPTLFMFGAGIIKYLERTFALFLASLGRFRDSMLRKPDPGTDYAKLMEVYSSKKDAGVPTIMVMTQEPDEESKLAACNVKEEGLSDLDLVTYAYHYFQLFKGLVVDLTFSFRERDHSRNFFQKRTAEDALALIVLELNFLHEAFYTKLVVVHSLVGYIFRSISLLFVLVAFIFFYSLDKHGFVDIDVKVTYTLLYGAIFLEFISFIMLFFSDYTIASIHTSWANRQFFGKCYMKLAQRFLLVKKIRWRSVSESSDNFQVLNTTRLLRRWSESVSCFNLIAHCLKQRPYEDKGSFRRWIEKIIYKYGLSDLVNDFFCAEKIATKKLPKRLWEYIFEDLLEKSKDAADDADTTKKIYSARGDYAIQEGCLEGDYHEITRDYIDNLFYDESLLLWHVATELCFQNAQENDAANVEDNYGGYCYFWCVPKRIPLFQWLYENCFPRKKYKAAANTEGISNDDRGLSKFLSDYMMYLLVKEPKLMSAVAGMWKLRFWDTRAETVKFFGRRGIKRGSKIACKAILGLNTEFSPVSIKGDRSKSVLFDACRLAKDLNKLEEKERWKIIIKVWVEMLSYAASHCRPDTHVQQVSKGGQLITFVWLLMAHFGLGEQFQINETRKRVTLFVVK